MKYPRHVTRRWRTARRDDIRPRRRVLLKSGRRATVRRVINRKPLLVLVAVDGRNPGDGSFDQCIWVGDLRVDKRYDARRIAS